MHAHNRAVDHLHPAIVGFHDSVHQLVPDARFPPAVEPIVHARVRPITFGQIAPRRAGAQDVEHAVDDLTVVLRLGPTPIHRHQRFDDAPLEIREIVSSHDPSSAVW